jgi:hypothetical protein
VEADTLRAFTEFVRTVGFPVATACALGFWQWYADKTSRAERAKENEATRAERAAAQAAFVAELQAAREGHATHQAEMGKKLDEQTVLLARLLERMTPGRA